MTTKKQMKQSETIVVKRSSINLNPFNPKKHTSESIERQKKNFKNLAYLGGIIINTKTNNIISGHKRTMAMDLHYGYDGTSENDYDIKIEAIELTEKQEKEQLIYMDARSNNTPQDFALLSEILPYIDISKTGLTDADLNLISIEVPNFEFGDSNEIINAFQDAGKPLDDKANAIKDLKKQMRGNVKQMQQDTFKEFDAYVILSFDNFENKAEFMERFSYNSKDNIIKGEVFSDQVERID